MGATPAGVGEAGGREAGVILEGPGESQEVRCASVNRHVVAGRRGRQLNSVRQLC